jgi:hypothetical protein
MCDPFWVAYFRHFYMIFPRWDKQPFWLHFFMLLMFIFMQIDDEECNHNVKQ